MAINVLGCTIDSSELSSTRDVNVANAITRGIIERSFADENTPIGILSHLMQMAT